MSSPIDLSVITILCQNQGCLEFKKLNQVLQRKMAVAEHVLFRELLDESKFLLIDGKEKSINPTGIRPNCLVIAKTTLRVCQNLQCLHCDSFLHLCRYFVCGNCRFGAKCKHPHSFDSPANRALLQKTGLSELGVGELCSLLLQNDPYLLPEICSHYNKGNGVHGSCRFQSKCTSLHVCQHFLLGDCKFGPACKRAHMFDASSVKILNGRGFSPENIRNLQLIYKNRLLMSGERPVAMKTAYKTISSPGPKLPFALPAVRERPRQHSGASISEADHNEICLYFIHRGCSFKDKCIRVHHALPYKWQISDSDGVTWKDLSNQEEVERAYCSPTNDKAPGDRPVNFLTMTSAGSQVRRLSTASSVTKPPHFILTTEWRWYWEDDQGGWNEYGVKAYGPAVASLTSETLEKAYLCSGDTDLSFDAKEQQYTIHLKEMYQQNQKYKTKREVRRRPFLQDVQTKLKCESSESSSSSSADVPAHWDQTALPNFTYKLVPLSASSDDFQKVEKMFKTTMSNSTVQSIRRIQNRSLWKVFQWQKEIMRERSGGKAVEERLLFHGTDHSLLEAICEQNFDWRMCGVHGTLYGKGSYFARDAAYSHNYCNSTSSIKIMFVARVLVGEFARGISRYVRPPAKGTAKGLYDSCVDNDSNPAIFVIFEKYQIYPEFAIEYRS